MVFAINLGLHYCTAFSLMQPNMWPDLWYVTWLSNIPNQTSCCLNRLSYYSIFLEIWYHTVVIALLKLCFVSLESHKGLASLVLLLCIGLRGIQIWPLAFIHLPTPFITYPPPTVIFTATSKHLPQTGHVLVPETYAPHIVCTHWAESWGCCVRSRTRSKDMMFVVHLFVCSWNGHTLNCRKYGVQCSVVENRVKTGLKRG